MIYRYLRFELKSFRSVAIKNKKAKLYEKRSILFWPEYIYAIIIIYVLLFVTMYHITIKTNNTCDWGSKRYKPTNLGGAD